MSTVILMLGGNAERIVRAVDALWVFEESTLIIGSETALSRVTRELAIRGFGEGVGRERVTFDFSAWDTVTNFTETRGLVGEPELLVVVTDRAHLRRSMAIARIVYLGSGIKLRGIPGPLGRRDSLWRTARDIVRAILWRVSGFVWHDPIVKARRMREIGAAAKAVG